MAKGTLQQIAQTDIYLIDQILKGRYDKGGKILDAGCGSGRNLSWFVAQPEFEIFATDIEDSVVADLLRTYPALGTENVKVAALQAMPFAGNFFDHIICQAVVHFANTKREYLDMFSELCRVLRPQGSLFMRMASDIGLAEKMIPLGNGRFIMPDGTERLLLNPDLITEVTARFPLVLAEPVKTTVVQNMRCMTTLVMEKCT